MGVHGLWQLLAPAGRRVDIAALSGRVLAVDVSIWLTQMLKAMRDDAGRMLPNAHLIGVFRRVARVRGVPLCECG
jgi:DNA excision repair protein ERCC-5